MRSRTSIGQGAGRRAPALARALVVALRSANRENCSVARGPGSRGIETQQGWSLVPRLSLAGLLLGIAVVQGQVPRNFLQNILGTKSVDEQPMLSSVAPRFGFNVASRAVKPAGPAEGGVISLEIDGNPVKLQLRYERQQGIDLYRIRHAPDSPLRGEQVRVSWSFSQGYNESITVDAGALQGQPLFLPNSKVPDNHFTNWGTLFYHREANIAVGTQLEGAEPSRHSC